MSPSHSGLQRSVLSLYRRALRAIRTKPAHARPKFLLTVRHAFRAHQVGPRDFGVVEVLLRRGRRRVEMWEERSVRDCWVSEEMRAWEREWRRGKGESRL